jgi:hypothetical protein
MTRWIHHYLFADSKSVPPGEHRLTWVKKDDDTITPSLSEQTPEEKAYDLDPFTRGTQREPGSLLKEVISKSEEELLSTIRTKGARDMIIRTALAQRRPGIQILTKMLDDPEVDSRQLRLKLEELFATKKKPEEDQALEEAMKATREKVSTNLDDQKKEPTNWQLFWEKIEQLGNPLYIRLARFLRNPAVAEHFSLSPDEAFQDLKNPEKRFSLFERLANMRHELVFQGQRNVEDRRKALDDLFAFLTHGQSLLSSTERASFYESFTRVGACLAVLDEYQEGLKRETEEQKNPEKTLYQEKFQRVGEFLGKDAKLSARSITGKDGLIDRLERAGERDGGEKNVFGILASGLREGGWIPSGPENLRYTCTLIALEEVGYLYMQIAQGKMEPKDTESLTAHVKMLVLEALRRGVTGKKGNVPFGTEFLDPHTQFAALEKKVQATPHPASEDINELILLYAWLKRRGETPRMSEEALRDLREKSAATKEELEADSKRARMLLPPEFMSASPAALLQALQGIEEEEHLYGSTPWKDEGAMGRYLRTACTFEQLTLIAEAEGEKTALAWLRSPDCPKNLSEFKNLVEGKYKYLLPTPEALSSQRAYAANMRLKREKKEQWEAPALHEMSDKEYVSNLQDIRKVAKGDEAKERSLITALNDSYDGENRERQKIHALHLSEERTHLLQALEAEIRLEAQRMRLTYFDGLWEKKEEIRDIEWDPFQHELDAARVLENLEHLDLGRSTYPLIEAENALEELKALRSLVAEPLKEAKEEDVEIEKGRKAARTLLKNSYVETHATPQTKQMLATCAAPDAPLGGRAVKALIFFEGHPEAFIEGQRMNASLEENAQTLYSGKELREWEKEYAPVLERIRNILPKYDPPRGYSLVEAFDFEGKEELALINPTPEAKQYLYRLRKFVSVLERINQERPDELPEEEFSKATGLPKNKLGAFIQKPEGKERIVLNTTQLSLLPQGAREAVLLEERLHVLNYAFARYVSPTFFPDFFDDMKRQYGEGFLAAAQRWVPRKHGMTDHDWKRDVADEFWAKRHVFLKSQNPRWTLSEKDIALFQDTENRATLASIRSKTKFRDIRQEFGVAAASHGDEHDGEGHTEEHTTIDDHFAEGSKASENLYKCKQSLIKARAFLKTYPDHGEFSSENKAYVDELEQEYTKANEEFIHRKHPEGDEAFEKRVVDIQSRFSDVVSEIAKFDMVREDLRNEPAAGRGILSLWRDVQWVNFFDIARMFKDIIEDIKRQHNRRQEGKVGRVGETMTHWIPAWVPYLGNLHHDFHDRRQKAEIEEVDHFKKALENVDSFELLHMAGHTENRDHLKAIIILLTERGRMNWNNEAIWKTFNKLSIFKMPIEECRRNENLREAWLRKIISDIWEDKDNYRGWKSKNESVFKEKMQSYTPEADRLSNLKGGLSGELEKQLRVYVEFKEGHQHGPMDEAIRPHLYNEILEYAIRNGKMSMEDKFFYLVQGLSCGLLTMDRLRILAGEGGEILNLFPFIDYFYGRNNTKPEIDVLATRLREDNNWKNDGYYRPGLKTTLWLELEVAREESVQQRLRKGAYRKGGEMDHDDMHFFIPRLDYKTIDSMATPQGGGRQQLTADGWRNGYSGYNSFFKSFGMLARLEKEGVNARFSSQDTEQVMRAVAGFVRMDGILTKRSAFGDNVGRRPAIPWSEMRTTYSVVSDGSKTVYQERNAVDRFVKKLLTAYGFSAKEIGDMLFSTEERPNPTKEEKEQAETLSDSLDVKLRAALKEQGAEKMKKILIESIGEFSSHAGTDYNYENVKNIYEKSQKAEHAHDVHANASSHH